MRNETLTVLILVFCFCSSLSCMDPSIAIKPVFQRFQSVVITSGVSLVFTLPLSSLLSSQSVTSVIHLQLLLKIYSRSLIHKKLVIINYVRNI